MDNSQDNVYAFKSPDTIYMIDSEMRNIILAKKQEGVWVCELCSEDVERKYQMFNHIRYRHIQIR